VSRTEALVVVNNVSKRFGATRALSDVSIEFRGGEIHGLVGENGAGKSTLGKIILGIHSADEGDLTLDGSSLHLSDPHDAASRGLVGVAQELSLLPAMSVVDNIVLGSEEHWGPIVDDRSNRRRVESLIAGHGLEVPLDARVSSLSVADQQKVEILRALGRDARLVVFDEPTARLASHEASELRQTVRDLADKGTAVLYISHFLEEVLSVADTITVMRDGRVVSTRPAHEETHDSLVEAMTGRALDDMFPPLAPEPDRGAPVVLSVDHISRTGEFEDVSLEIKAGEIVGLAGLVGAGRSEVALSIYGASSISEGTVEISGKRSLGTIKDGLANAISLIPESRRDQALIVGQSVRQNITLPYLRRFSSWIGMRPRLEREAALVAFNDVGVKAEGLDVPVSSLSGGNQQKVVLARAVLGDPRLLIADEPTRGVDVGAKRAIYDVVTQLAASGCAVLLVSSELEEIIGLSHRVLVMRLGRVVAEYSGDDITETNILNAAFGAGADSSTNESTARQPEEP